MVKQASTPDLNKAAALMERILEENPKLWPNGLTVGHFRPGDLWLIQKSAASEPVGFVGWQARQTDGVTTGYYSIGVLPEHRNQGIAKKAVAKLLATKAASVTQVRSYTVPGNVASERLARSLDVPVEKAASLARVLQFMSKYKTPLSAVGTGTLGAGLQDQIIHGDGQGGASTRQRLTEGAFNALGYGSGGALLANKSYGLGTLATLFPVAKLDRVSAMRDREHSMALGDKRLALDTMIANKPQASVTGGAGNTDGGGSNLLPAALIASALGLGAYGLYKGLGNQQSAQKSTAQGGRIKVTLPTKNPSDAETSIDLPFDEFQALSPALRQKIERDTRRRLYAETNARTRRIGTQPLTAVA